MIGIWRLNKWIGGTEKSLIELASFLQNKLKYDVVLYGSTEGLGRFAETLGVQIKPEAEIEKDCRKIKLLLVYDEITNSIGGDYVSCLGQIPKRIAIYGGFSVSLATNDVLGKQALAKTYKIKHWLQYFNDRYKTAPVKVSQFPIDLNYWKRGEVAQRDVPVIGYVGRDDKDKNLPEWCELVHGVTKGESVIYMTNCVMKSPEVKWMQDMGNKIILNVQVTKEVYETMDLFISLSLREGVPRSLMEAMAMSLPVITYDVGGTYELNPKYFFSPGLDNELVDITKRLMRSHSFREEVGRANRKNIELYNGYLERDLADYFKDVYA